MATTLARIEFRRKTAAQWTSSNEVLLASEPGVETDTGKWKFGDGTTTWSALPYQAPTAASLSATYLTQANAATTYETATDAAGKPNLTDFTTTGWAVAQAVDAAAARSAIGAAAASAASSKTLVAGDNVTFTEGSTTITVAAAWGVSRVESIPVEVCSDATVGTTTGGLRLVFFTASKSGTYSNVTIASGTTAAAATPTTVQVGIYSVDASDNITLIGSTANDTTLFASASTVYTKPLQSSVSLAAGTRYAVGVLIVTAAATPTFLGKIMGSSTVAGIGPGRKTALVAGQTTLLSSIANTSFTNSNAGIYGRLT